MDRFDSIIFDLDGTLWDSTQPVTQAWNAALERVGRSKKFTTTQIAGIMGMPHEKILETLFSDISPSEREGLAETCYAQEIELLKRKGAALYPGVSEGLEALAQKYPLFLVSNCQTPYLRAFFACTGLGRLFRDSECHGNTKRTKGENIKLIRSRNALKFSAYVGDTTGDQMAAEAGGAVYFHVSYGFGSPYKDCLVFDSFAEACQFFLSLPAEK